MYILAWHTNLTWYEICLIYFCSPCMHDSYTSTNKTNEIYTVHVPSIWSCIPSITACLHESVTSYHNSALSSNSGSCSINCPVPSSIGHMNHSTLMNYSSLDPCHVSHYDTRGQHKYRTATKHQNNIWIVTTTC